MAKQAANFNQIYGRKLGMTRVFTEDGESVPVTVIEVQPNVVCQVKTKDNDGYEAVQIGLGAQKPQRLSRALSNHYSKAQKGVFKTAREIRFDFPGQRKALQKASELKIGDEIALGALFAVGELVDVVGTSLGKGFQGVMKRHHMKGNPMTRGTHEYRRHGGSIGCRKTPGRTFKNKRMPGRMGGERITQPNLKVIQVRAEENLILVRGSIPGPKNDFVLLRSAVKSQRSSKES